MIKKYRKYLLYILAYKSLIYAKIYSGLEKYPPTTPLTYIIYWSFQMHLLKSMHNNIVKIKQILKQ